MKGPYQRLKFDLRRLWECPVCQHRTYTAGDVTSLVCRCQQQVDEMSRRFMHLIEDAPTTKPASTFGPETPIPETTIQETTIQETSRTIPGPIGDSLPSPD